VAKNAFRLELGVMFRSVETLENRIHALGSEIFARVREGEGGVSPAQWVNQAMMNLAMRDKAVKGQLFRFVDVLPGLKSAGQVAGHLREYLLPVGDRLPGGVRSALGFGAGNSFFDSIIAAATGFGVHRMARGFIAATDLDQAVRAIARLRARGLAFTVDLLGEAVVSEAEAIDYQRQYLSLVTELPVRIAKMPAVAMIDRDASGEIPRANISVKLSSLYSQFDPIDPAGTSAAVLGRLRPILRTARAAGAFINFDMEQRSFKDLTISIFREVFSEEEFRDWADVGIAMQAYLKCTLEDLQSLAKWAEGRGTSVWVRLVKGAYWDFETVMAEQRGWASPVFGRKLETDANFEACTEFLMANHRVLRPAIASHNVRSLAAALALAERYRVKPLDFELQMLFGMADPIKRALTEMGHRVRVYTPFGKLLPGMAYLVRRLLENTSNESFLRAGFVEHVPEEILLMNPNEQLRERELAAKARAEKEAALAGGVAPGGLLSSGVGSSAMAAVSKADPHKAHPDEEAMPPRRSRLARVFRNEPLMDFSLAESRARMLAAIAKMPGRIECPVVIGGKKIVGAQWIESINPSHNSRIVGVSGRATVAHAEQAVAAAKAAFASWRDVAAEERSALLERVANILARDRFELAAIEIAECGKPWREADADVAEAIDFCRYYVWQMQELARPGGSHLPGERNDWVYDSRGVAVVIAPWNFPLAILCGMTAAAVVSGNTAIMKPAEQSSIIASRLMAAFEEAGAPAGVVNYLPGVGEEIGPGLVKHPEVAMVAFTGSRAVGLSINQEAAITLAGQTHIKRVIVELGGKNAIIVDEDADLDEAVAGVTESAFGYAGQKCSACSRVIVLAGVYDAFLARLIEAAKSLKIAPAEEPACRVGPVIDGEAFPRILATIEREKASSRLAYAGDVGALSGEGYFIGPHIFAEVSSESALASEEIFGPVLAVMKAEDLGEALSIANGVAYALTGGVYSRSPANIARCRREFRVGDLYINRKITGALVGQQPFGGFKLSGGGTQAGGPDYLRHFLLPRCVTENTLRRGFEAE
jgi:RHH-type proline utilization regulon transcriptional repressor/proline dehydrogenase/delta 1-pyrroline-5-carboxylate dehydrogenase